MKNSRQPFALFLASLACVTPASADLVAYFPVTAATDSSTFLDDIIDDPSHGVADGTSSNENASIVVDPVRGEVVETVQGHRYRAGTQDIDLAVGFSWSLWFKAASADVNKNDPGADVIIGSRNGIWNKVQPTGTQRYFDLRGYDIDDGEWHHIAYTGDNVVGGALWIDGVKIASDATPFNNVQIVNDVFEIGGSSRFTEDVDAFIDDIGIWNEVLSDEIIIGLANGDPIVPGIGGGGGDLVVTEISYDAVSDSVTLTWRADENVTYRIFVSPDLSDWTNELAGGINATADEDLSDEGLFTFTVDLNGTEFPGASQLFFRVEED